MRHRKKTRKLQRDASQRKALLSGLACALIRERKIRTTLARAKALRPVAEKLVTLGKRGDVHARRQAVAFLRHKDIVRTLFDVVAHACAERQGGYCRITKLGPRFSDAAPMAIIEWVDLAVEAGSEEDEELEEVAETTASDS